MKWHVRCHFIRAELPISGEAHNEVLSLEVHTIPPRYANTPDREMLRKIRSPSKDHAACHPNEAPALDTTDNPRT